MYDLAITNGTVVSDGRRAEADIGVVGGSIACVAPHGQLGPARHTIDAAGRLVLPGAIDIHFHCRAPSHPERGDFASESRAAAAGGVTTIFEMPISDPACSRPEVLNARRELASAQCYVDFALYAGGGHGDAALARAMAEEGAIGFKIFTTAPPPGRASEFDGLCAVGEDELHAAMTAVAATGLPCVFHAENQRLITYFARSVRQGVPPRPPVVEAAEIALIAALARDTGARAHIAHLTSAAGVAAVRAARALAPALTAETCPQYLLFDQSAVARWGAFAKIAPPLREARDAEVLWDGIRDGTITVLASDHSPFRVQDKTSVPFADAPPGMPSVETMVPSLLDAALRGVLPLEQAVDLVTAAPARLFGIYGRKGTIAAGADADLVLVAPDTQVTVRRSALHTRAAECAVVYDGMVLQGRVELTMLAGAVVYDGSVIVGSPRGRFVRPGGQGSLAARGL